MKQFIISTTLVVILVMVVISMAIIIPSTKIYEQTNNKIIDNQITKVEINENQATQNTGIRNGMDRTIYARNYEEDGAETYGRILDSFNNYSLSNKTSGGGLLTSYNYYIEETLEINIEGETEEDFSSFDLYISQNEYECGNELYVKGSVLVKLQKNMVTNKAGFDALGISSQTHTVIRTSGNSFFTILGSGAPMVYAIDTTLSTDNKLIIYFKVLYFSSLNYEPETSEVEKIEIPPTAPLIAFLESFTYHPSYTSVTQTSTKITNGVGSKPILLSSNELITNLTTINSDTYTDIASAFVLSGYANGKETATVLCDISEYYDDNLVLSISTKDNELPMIFNIGDLVIPYVTKNIYDSITGKYSLTEVPLSMINGNPKLFKVVSNKIISDGVPRQRLTLVESEKEYANTTTCIATDITAVGLSITNPTELTYIPTSDNLTTFTFNPRIGDGIKLIGVKGATTFPIWKYNDTEITFGSGSEYARYGIATTNPYITFTASATTVGDIYECTRDTTISGFRVDLSGGTDFGILGTGGIFLDGFKFSDVENQYVYPKTGNAVKIICYPPIGETVAWYYNGNPITSGVGGYTIANTGGLFPKSELTFTANATNCNGTYLGASS
jgi:hypothetical protein